MNDRPSNSKTVCFDEVKARQIEDRRADRMRHYPSKAVDRQSKAHVLLLKFVASDLFYFNSNSQLGQIFIQSNHSGEMQCDLKYSKYDQIRKSI